jgi:hypothetical protein
MSDQPIEHGENMVGALGRDPATGRLLPGHTISRGNGGGRHRKKLNDAISEEDIEKAVACLRGIMEDASGKACDRLAAAREILDRSCGRPAPADLIERVERLEELLERENDE